MELLILLLHPFNGLFSRTTRVSRYQKGKTGLDLNEAIGNRVLGRQWHQLDHMQTIWSSLQANSHTKSSIFTGRMLFLMPNQQCESTEGNGNITKKHKDNKMRGQMSTTWRSAVVRHSRNDRGAQRHDSDAVELCQQATLSRLPQRSEPHGTSRLPVIPAPQQTTQVCVMNHRRRTDKYLDTRHPITTAADCVATDRFQKSQPQDGGLPELLLAYYCTTNHSKAALHHHHHHHHIFLYL